MNSARVILSLDLGTTTGWAIHNKENLIISGSECFHPRRFEGGGMRYLQFVKWLDNLLKTLDYIECVCFEEVRRHIGTDAAHTYGGFLASLTSWCERNVIPYEGIPVGTIKKFITGKGNASKEDVINAVTAIGHNPKDDNEADAIALLYFFLKN